jgi:hypothetical protein
MPFSPLNYVSYISACGLPVKVESPVDAEKNSPNLGVPLDIGALDLYNHKKLIFSLEGTSNSGPSPVKRKIEFLAEMYG